jgi:hypothetical protein
MGDVKDIKTKVCSMRVHKAYLALRERTALYSHDACASPPRANLYLPYLLNPQSHGISAYCVLPQYFSKTLIRFSMAEVVAVMASVIAIIQISDRVISLTKYYIESTSGAPSELRIILVEVSTLNVIFKSLEYLEKCDHTSPALWSQIAGPDGPVEGCRQSIKALEGLFPSESIALPAQNGQPRSAKKCKVDALLNTLAWPLKAHRARDLLQKITQYKTLINLALSTESM